MVDRYVLGGTSLGSVIGRSRLGEANKTWIMYKLAWSLE